MFGEMHLHELLIDRCSEYSCIKTLKSWQIMYSEPSSDHIVTTPTLHEKRNIEFACLQEEYAVKTNYV